MTAGKLYIDYRVWDETGNMSIPEQNRCWWWQGGDAYGRAGADKESALLALRNELLNHGFHSYYEED